MKIAVISDVHGRLSPLEAALDAIDTHGPDAIWCLGDVVDAFEARREEQAACVELVQQRCAIRLGGNHEAWVLQRSVLPPEVLVTIADWSPRACLHGIRAVHASPRNPLMEFVNTADVAAANLAALDQRLCVFGHTHQATLAGRRRSDGRLRFGRPVLGVNVLLSGLERVMLNPGAIADEASPSWMLLDLERDSALWRSVAT